MNPVCPSFDFYERKVNEHGGEKRRSLVFLGEDGDKASCENLVAIIVEANDGEVFIVTATPENDDTQTNHRFVFFSSTYEEICQEPLPFIQTGIEQFLVAVRQSCQGTA